MIAVRPVHPELAFQLEQPRDRKPEADDQAGHCGQRDEGSLVAMQVQSHDYSMFSLLSCQTHRAS